MGVLLQERMGILLRERTVVLECRVGVLLRECLIGVLLQEHLIGVLLRERLIGFLLRERSGERESLLLRWRRRRDFLDFLCFRLDLMEFTSACKSTSFVDSSWVNSGTDRDLSCDTCSSYEKDRGGIDCGFLLY